MRGAHAVDRWLYRGRRPNRIARVLNRGWSWLAAAGLGPAQLSSLEVRGRRSGTVVRFPVVVADHAGERYLVSMLGDGTNWVRNVRAARGYAVLRRGQRDIVRLEEVVPADRAPILRRYLELAPGARSHMPVGPEDALDDVGRVATRYPVFRVHVLDRAPSAALR